MAVQGQRLRVRCLIKGQVGFTVQSESSSDPPLLSLSLSLSATKCCTLDEANDLRQCCRSTAPQEECSNFPPLFFAESLHS